MSRGRIVVVSGNAGINRWPLLSDSLIDMDNFDSLADTIKHIIDKTSAERKEISLRAIHSARKINKENIKNWIEIFKNISEQKLSK